MAGWGPLTTDRGRSCWSAATGWTTPCTRCSKANSAGRRARRSADRQSGIGLATTCERRPLAVVVLYGW